MAVRDAVSWKGRGRPSSPSASASPSSTNDVAGSDRATSTTSGSRAVMSSSERVATSTSSPERCTWIRMPSSFTSTATSAPPPALARASATSGALEASIGSTGRPTWSPIAPSASTPPSIAARGDRHGRAGQHRGPAYGGQGDLGRHRQTPPGRASRARPGGPRRSRPHAARSAPRPVARPKSSATAAARADCDPEPDSAAIRSNASCTSATVSDGVERQAPAATTARASPGRCGAGAARRRRTP